MKPSPVIVALRIRVARGMVAWVWVILDPSGLSADSVALLTTSDFGWATLVSGAVALIWGVILRPVLAFLVLRKTAAPKETGVPLDV